MIEDINVYGGILLGIIGSVVLSVAANLLTPFIGQRVSLLFESRKVRRLTQFRVDVRYHALNELFPHGEVARVVYATGLGVSMMILGGIGLSISMQMTTVVISMILMAASMVAMGAAFFLAFRNVERMVRDLNNPAKAYTHLRQRADRLGLDFDAVLNEVRDEARARLPPT